MITFSSSARMEFGLRQYDNATIMSDVIKDIHYVDGTTNTADALNMLRTNMMNDGRGSVPVIAVLFTGTISVGHR